MNRPPKPTKYQVEMVKKNFDQGNAFGADAYGSLNAIRCRAEWENAKMRKVLGDIRTALAAWSEAFPKTIKAMNELFEEIDR